MFVYQRLCWSIGIPVDFSGQTAICRNGNRPSNLPNLSMAFRQGPSELLVGKSAKMQVEHYESSSNCQNGKSLLPPSSAALST